MTTKKERHALICASLNGTYERKNHDYGDSFAQLRARQPNAILVRLYDKYLRLETLLGGATQEVKDESIDDTLMDMANYCIMELVERQIEREREVKPVPPNVTSDKPEPWNMDDDDRRFKICSKSTCEKCCFSSKSNGKAKHVDCYRWCFTHPAEARKIMDEWEVEHEVD